MKQLTTGDLTEVAVLGAHCDDIAIGMGATLLTLCRANPGLRVGALVLSGGGTDREAEERLALAALCPGASLALTVLDIPDGCAPAYWHRIKVALGRFRREVQPDLVFATQRHDAHQDHRVLAELVPTEFRDHLILGYEIIKWETDTPVPTVFHPVDRTDIDEKWRVLDRFYRSQAARDWFDSETFAGLARVRGVQCHRPYAEAFVMEKAIITLRGDT